MNLNKYPGNKGFDKAKIEIINRIPPHKIFIEGFAGSAAIGRTIYKSGSKVILNEINPQVYYVLKNILPEDIDILNLDYLDFNTWLLYLVPQIKLSSWAINGNIYMDPKDIVIYLDPPYPKNSRRSPKDIYKYEMSDADHVKLLETVLQYRYNCMISTYENDIYSEYLKDWSKATFKVNVHGNIATEVLYFNYPEPTELQIYDYLGKDNTDRQRINRKNDRILKKFSSMPDLERNKILQSLNSKFK